MDNELDLVEVPEIDLPAEGEEDSTDWKAKAEEYKALAEKNYGIGKRFKTKLDKVAAPKEQPPIDKSVPPPAPKAEEAKLDRADKAYLLGLGYKAEDFETVEELLKETGKDLDSLTTSNYFKTVLKEKQEARASQEAIPSGSKRGVGSQKEKVDFWLERGELPPADKPELRKQYLAERLRREGGGKRGGF